MSVVAGTPSIDMPKAWRVTTWPFWVTLMMTERRCSVAIAFWTMSVIADAVCPGGVAAEVAVAPDAAAGTPRADTARRAPVTRTRRAGPSGPRSMCVITTPHLGLDTTSGGSRPCGGIGRGGFHPADWDLIGGTNVPHQAAR